MDVFTEFIEITIAYVFGKKKLIFIDDSYKGNLKLASAHCTD